MASLCRGAQRLVAQMVRRSAAAVGFGGGMDPSRPELGDDQIGDVEDDPVRRAVDPLANGQERANRG